MFGQYWILQYKKRLIIIYWCLLKNQDLIVWHLYVKINIAL